MHRKQSKWNKRRIQSVADTLIPFFHKNNIKIMQYRAYSTNSIYLKLDYGMLYSIRLSDHSGKKHLKYRFNAIVGYKGPKTFKTDWSWNQEFYDFSTENLNAMCKSILALKNSLLKELGPYGYEHEMNERLSKNRDSKGFWKQAKDLG